LTQDAFHPVLMDIFKYENKKQIIGYDFSCESRTGKFWRQIDRKTPEESRTQWMLGS